MYIIKLDWVTFWPHQFPSFKLTPILFIYIFFFFFYSQQTFSVPPKNVIIQPYHFVFGRWHCAVLYRVLCCFCYIHRITQRIPAHIYVIQNKTYKTLIINNLYSISPFIYSFIHPSVSTPFLKTVFPGLIYNVLLYGVCIIKYFKCI